MRVFLLDAARVCSCCSDVAADFATYVPEPLLSGVKKLDTAEVPLESGNMKTKTIAAQRGNNLSPHTHNGENPCHDGEAHTPTVRTHALTIVT